MTNQMRKIVRAIFFTVLAANVLFVVLLFVGSFGFASWITYFALGVNVASSVWLGLFLLDDMKKEKFYISKLKIAKDIIKRRNEILSNFYKQSNIPLQYDKNGNLRDLDSIMGIVSEYDKDGNLLPTIYEILMISPMFDENGREIPTVLVIKHLVTRFKTDNLENLAGMKFIRKPEEGEVLKEGSKAAAIQKKNKEKAKISENKKKSEASKPNFVKYKTTKAVLFNYKLDFEKTPKMNKDRFGKLKNENVSQNSTNVVTPSQRPVVERQPQSQRNFRQSESNFLRGANARREPAEYVYPPVEPDPEEKNKEDINKNESAWE